MSNWKETWSNMPFKYWFVSIFEHCLALYISFFLWDNIKWDFQNEMETEIDWNILCYIV